MDIQYLDRFLTQNMFPLASTYVDHAAYCSSAFLQGIDIREAWKVQLSTPRQTQQTQQTQQSREDDVALVQAEKQEPVQRDHWAGGWTLWRALIHFVDPSIVLLTQDRVRDEMADELRKVVMLLYTEKGLPLCIGPKAYREVLRFIDTPNAPIHPSSPHWNSVCCMLSFLFEANIEVEGYPHPENLGYTYTETIYLRCTQRRQWLMRLSG